MPLSVRFADVPADRDAALRVRAAVLNDEFGRGHPVDGEGRMTEQVDRTARLLLAESDGEPVGTVRLHWGGDAPFSAEDRAIYDLDSLEAAVPPERIVIFSRFAAKAAFRGGDVPGQLFDAIIRFAIAQGACVVLCDCRPQLANLYLGLGMRVLRPFVTVPSAGILVPMALLLDDPGHIAASGSRIVPLLRGVTADAGRRDALLALLPPVPVVERLDRPEEAPGWTRMVHLLANTSPERFPIFRGLPSADVARLVTRGNVIACRAGDVVLRQGDRESMVFVVLEGAVEVVRDGRRVASLGPGSVFGEIGFLAGVPHTAAIVTSCDTRLVCLRPRVLSGLIEGAPEVAAPLLLNLARILAVRLAATTAVPGEEPALP